MQLGRAEFDNKNLWEPRDAATAAAAAVAVSALRRGHNGHSRRVASRRVESHRSPRVAPPRVSSPISSPRRGARAKFQAVDAALKLSTSSSRAGHYRASDGLRYWLRLSSLAARHATHAADTSPAAGLETTPQTQQNNGLILKLMRASYGVLDAATTRHEARGAADQTQSRTRPGRLLECAHSRRTAACGHSERFNHARTSTPLGPSASAPQSEPTDKQHSTQGLK